MDLSIEQIKPNPNQPRKECDPEKLRELTDSIKSIGLLNPILVRPIESDYEIVHGERRWRACKLAGLTEIRAEIRELTDEQAFLIALTENIQRDDLTPIEEARAFQFMVDDLGYTQAKVGETIGMSQQYVADRLVLLKLSEPVQSMITARAVSPSIGRMLARHDNPEESKSLAVEVAEGSLTVKGLEQVLRGEKPTEGAQFVILPEDDDPIETLNYCRHHFDRVKPDNERLLKWCETQFPKIDELVEKGEYREGFKLAAKVRETSFQCAIECEELWIREIRAGYQLYEALGEYLTSNHAELREYAKSAQAIIRDKNGTGRHLWGKMKDLANIPLGALNEYFDRCIKRETQITSDGVIRFWSKEVWQRQKNKRIAALEQV